MLLNFWASWCGPCRDELPLLERYAARWGAVQGDPDAPAANAQTGPVVVAVNLAESAETVRRAARSFGLRYIPLVLDPHGEVADAYHVWSLPTTFVIDPGGTVAARWVGTVAEEELAALH